MIQNSVQPQSGVQDLLFELAGELSRLVIREHQILQGELNQVCALVEDAVQALGGNFRELNICVSKQVALVANVKSDVAANDNEKLAELSKQVNAYTAKLTRALQFDDIVQQLAGHACDRIGQMQELFSVLDKQVAELKTNKHGNTDESQNHLQTMLVNIIKYRRLLEKENPVKQDSISEGGIELF